MFTNDATGKEITYGSKVTLPTMVVQTMNGGANGDFLGLVPLGEDGKPVADVQALSVKAAMVNVQA